MICTKAEFASLAGVSKAAITQGVKRALVVETADHLIDTDHPTNSGYLAKRGARAPDTAKPAPAKKRPSAPVAPPAPPKAKAKKPPVGTTLPPLAGADLDDLGEADSGADDDLEGIDPRAKTAIDIRLKRAQAKRHELRFEQDKRNLLLADQVRQAAAKANAEIRVRIQDLPKRITPRLVAMALSGASEREIQQVLEREIDNGLEAVAAAIEAAGA